MNFYYAVLSLEENVILKDKDGNEISQKLKGIDGYIPVFTDLGKALKLAEEKNCRLLRLNA